MHAYLRRNSALGFVHTHTQRSHEPIVNHFAQRKKNRDMPHVPTLLWNPGCLSLVFMDVIAGFTAGGGGAKPRMTVTSNFLGPVGSTLSSPRRTLVPSRPPMRLLSSSPGMITWNKTRVEGEQAFTSMEYYHIHTYQRVSRWGSPLQTQADRACGSGLFWQQGHQARLQKP
jgi:hypothetical protein